MNNKIFRQKFILVLLLYTILILFVWFLYHNAVYSYVRKTVYENMEIQSRKLMNLVENELTNMQVTASIIGGSTFVKDFLTETDLNQYYEKALTVAEIISKASNINSPFDSFIITDKNGDFYRFSGGLSNRSIQKIYQSFKDNGAVFTDIELDGTQYFCHVSPVFYSLDISEQPIGYIIIVNTLAKTRRIMDSDTISGLDAAVVSGDTVLLSTNQALESASLSDFENYYGLVTKTNISGTDLFVVSAVNKGTLSAPNRLFAIIAAAVTFLFLLLICILHRSLSNVVVNPLLVTKDNMQINLLGTQMDAHFVVNTLHTTRILLQKKEYDRAEQMTNGLTEMLKHQHSRMCNVFAELSILDHYIDIMKVRYLDQFTFETEVSEELADYQMQSFLLQPVIENAFSHGFSAKCPDFTVSLKGTLKNGVIFFEISDNGTGISQDELELIRKNLKAAESNELSGQGLQKIALLNIQKRIQAMHGTSFGISIDSQTEGGTSITLRLPAIKDSVAD